MAALAATAAMCMTNPNGPVQGAQLAMAPVASTPVQGQSIGLAGVAELLSAGLGQQDQTDLAAWDRPRMAQQWGALGGFLRDGLSKAREGLEGATGGHGLI